MTEYLENESKDHSENYKNKNTDTDKKKGYGGRFSSSPISTSGSIEVGRKQFKKIIKAATTTNHSPELAKWL